MNKRTNHLIALALATLFVASCSKGEVHGLSAGEALTLNVKQAAASGDPLWVQLVSGGAQCLVVDDDFQGTVNGAPLEVVARGAEVDAGEGTTCLPISLRGPATTPGEDLSIRVWDDTMVIEAQFPDVSISPVSATRCTGASSCTLTRTATTK